MLIELRFSSNQNGLTLERVGVPNFWEEQVKNRVGMRKIPN